MISNRIETPEEVDALAVGRILDTQVARRVLGLENIDWVCAIPVNMGGNGNAGVVPHYSTDPDEAQVVRIELERRGYTVVTEHLPSTRMERVEVRAPQDENGESRIYSATAPTLPEATCRAALLAVLDAAERTRTLRRAA